MICESFFCQFFPDPDKRCINTPTEGGLIGLIKGCEVYCFVVHQILFLMNHFISLQEAVAMTSRYRLNYQSILASSYQNQGILPLSEAFDRAPFDVLLSKEGCSGLRFYYGMDEQLKVHAIVVATDANGHDMLPPEGVMTLTEEEDIIEKGNRCPDICPDPSPLNS